MNEVFRETEMDENLGQKLRNIKYSDRTLGAYIQGLNR